MDIERKIYISVKYGFLSKGFSAKARASAKGICYRVRVYSRYRTFLSRHLAKRSRAILPCGIVPIQNPRGYCYYTKDDPEPLLTTIFRRIHILSAPDIYYLSKKATLTRIDGCEPALLTGKLVHIYQVYRVKTILVTICNILLP